MKKTIILFLIIPNFLLAQKQYAPLNATWRYEVFSAECYNNFLRYNVEEEIEIDGKDCSVIYAYTSMNLAPFEKTQDSLIVWENENKVYFYQNDDFWLLYDFDMEEGDILNYYLPYGKGVFSPYLPQDQYSMPYKSILEVMEVEDIDVNGTLLKKYNTRYIWPDDGEIINNMGTIIENVGSIRGRLLGQDEEYIAIGCEPDFLCYEDDDMSYPPNEVCEYPTSTKNIYTDNEIRFYPNPVEGFLSIENNTSESIKSVQFFNINGQIADEFYGPNAVINVDHLTKGFYAIKMTFDSEAVHYSKIIKQ